MKVSSSLDTILEASACGEGFGARSIGSGKAGYALF
jgi:hypothetical protein